MNNVQQLPIGVFDSGVGGLSVLKVLQEQFPNEDFIYIGDNANNPVAVSYTHLTLPTTPYV